MMEKFNELIIITMMKINNTAQQSTAFNEPFELKIPSILF